MSFPFLVSTQPKVSYEFRLLFRNVKGDTMTKLIFAMNNGESEFYFIFNQIAWCPRGWSLGTVQNFETK